MQDRAKSVIVWADHHSSVTASMGIFPDDRRAIVCEFLTPKNGVAHYKHYFERKIQIGKQINRHTSLVIMQLPNL